MKLRILAGVAWVAVLWGQPQQPVPGDAPGRVARLSFIHGSVQYRPDSVPDWAAATLNYPLSNGDHLWTDRDAQAEVHVGLTAIHLAPETGFFIALLDDRAFRMGLAEGALNIRIPRMNDGETVEVETRYGKFRLLATGSYRVDVQPEGDYASLIVRSGSAEAVAGTQTFAVPAGRRAVLSGKPAVVELLDAPAPDPWDEWCAARDEQAERSYEKSQEHVSWEISGAADFADYGDWQSDAEFGWCWFPRALPAGWAPYRFGHWIWKGPWGWTWVDHAPWGFAVSHWGRWTRARNTWAWVPDPKRFQPRYSPAHVAFGRTEGSRFVSWVPLGPGEVAGRPRGLRNREAVTAVAEKDFAASRGIAAARLLVLDRGATEFSGRTAEIMPTRESVLGGRAIEGGPRRKQNAQPVAVAPPPAPVPSPAPRIEPRDLPRRVEPPVARDEEEHRNQRLRQEGEEQQREQERRRVDLQRRAERARQEAEDYQRAQERRRQEDDDRRRQADDQRRRQEDDDRRRQADDQRRRQEDDDRRRADDHRRQEEARRQADDHRRQEESRRQADDARRQEEGRRQADEARRQADEGRRQQAEQQRQQEQQRTNEVRKK